MRDVIGARVFEDGGFAAVGTTSFGIARAHGLKDVLAGPHTPPVGVLQELGVKRLSLGSGPIRATLGLLKAIAAELQGAGAYRHLDDALPYDAANEL